VAITAAIRRTGIKIAATIPPEPLDDSDSTSVVTGVTLGVFVGVVVVGCVVSVLVEPLFKLSVRSFTPSVF